MARRGRARPTAVAKAERDEQILAARRSGASFRQIAREIGCSSTTAHNVVSRHLDALAADSLDHADRYRAEELDRLMALLAVCWAVLDEGEPRQQLAAVDRILRIGGRRAKLLGLDMPTKIAPTTPDGDKTYQPPSYDLSMLSDDELRQLRDLRIKIDGAAENAA